MSRAEGTDFDCQVGDPRRIDLGTCSKCDDHNNPCVCRAKCACEGHKDHGPESERALIRRVAIAIHWAVYGREPTEPLETRGGALDPSTATYKSAVAAVRAIKEGADG